MVEIHPGLSEFGFFFSLIPPKMFGCGVQLRNRFFDGGAAQRHSPVLKCSRATKALLIGSFLTSRKPSIRFRGILTLMDGHPTSDVAACCVALCGACASHPLASVEHKHFAFQTCGVMPTVGSYLIAWDLCCTRPVRGRFPSISAVSRSTVDTEIT